jgi:hypothetical protein
MVSGVRRIVGTNAYRGRMRRTSANLEHSGIYGTVASQCDKNDDIKGIGGRQSIITTQKRYQSTLSAGPKYDFCFGFPTVLL